METPVTCDQNPQPQIKHRPCFFCGQHMYGTSKHEVTNERTGQIYMKWGHVCPHCDYWTYSRVPMKLYPQMDGNHFQQADVDPEEDVIPPVTNVLDWHAQQPFKNMVEIRFTCLFCHNPMGAVYRGEDENKRTGQRYVKTRYYCRHCDYWHTIKVPRKLAESVTREHTPVS